MSTPPVWLPHPCLSARVCLEGAPVWIDAQPVGGYLVAADTTRYPPVLYPTLAAARHAALALARQLAWEYERVPTLREQAYVNAALADALKPAKREPSDP